MFLRETVNNFFISSCLICKVKYSLEYDRPYSGYFNKRNIGKLSIVIRYQRFKIFNCPVYSKNYNVICEFVGIKGIYL